MVDVAAALIFKDGRFMICKRPDNKTRGGLWEFVGGKLEAGETAQQALVRECREELGVEIKVGNLFMQLVHEYPDMTVNLSLYESEIASGTPQLLEHSEIKWIAPHEAAQYDFCPADADILKELVRRENMQRVCDFLKKAGTYYLATDDNGQPRVRPFGTAHIFDGKLYIQTGRSKAVSRQLSLNPKAEICAFCDGTWIRVAGELVEDDRREARVSMLDAYPSLKAMYDADDGNTQVLYFNGASATLSSFTAPGEQLDF